MAFWEKQSQRDRNQISGCQALSVERKGPKETFWGNGKVCLDCGGDYMILYIYGNSIKYTPKKVLNFALCKLYSNKPDSKIELLR